MTAITGIVLFGVIGNRLASMLREEEQREPALPVFRATASGLNAWDIGSVFRGHKRGDLLLWRTSRGPSVHRTNGSANGDGGRLRTSAVC